MDEARAGAASPTAHSPLAGLEPLDCLELRLDERQELGALILRGAGARFLATAARVLGRALPTQPNTTRRCGPRLALWLGPDEWLVRQPIAEVEAVAGSLRRALVDTHATVVDVSDRACVLRLSGAAARGVLAQGCPLDLHPRAFRPGDCAQSHYLKSAILIDQVDDLPTYDLQVPRSCARYLWDLLVEASRELARDGSARGP